MSAPSMVRPGISEGELIEIETRASAIGDAEELIARKIEKAEELHKHVPYSLWLALQRLQLLRADVRRLIDMAREKSQ